MLKARVVGDLRRILKQREVSQNWLSKAVEVQPGVISQIANCRRVPQLKLALLIADALECKVQDIWNLK